MDILSHGLWGGGVFGRKSKIFFLRAFLFGIAPDLFSFGILSIAVTFGLQQPVFKFGHALPPMSAIPQYVHQLYDLTHSLVVFAAVFSLVYLALGKPFYPMLAWGLHVVMDIFTHDLSFFPTPFLWPIADYKFDGLHWGLPIIFIPNVILLGGLYLFIFLKRKRVAQPSREIAD